jgi:hypothetical protein
MVTEGQVQGQAGQDFLCYKLHYNQTTIWLNLKLHFVFCFATASVSQTMH